ncbi:DUF3298 and DUF4163 domain-containing protein [Tissierella pigra]|uniref:DUF3298 and DUF4163 domain-containing protein n=1 Tax=Tissierella pigra TaxID=2607614 RepID=A0A6N7Y2I9_9FIRM|nr:DUF3298 and DUF4163 domain-containing protein [Tissierella pigra]MBU5427352.1 DUF3298 and DUF4163 domain-containing protein [Tissierella pigra]MSU03064.1 DUF3298 and DUF4163 domain-containing protein [Tissierella pigra]
MNNKLEESKKEYMNISIPDELEFIVKKSIKEGRKNSMKKDNKYKILKTTAASVAAAALLITAGVNTSPSLAENLSEVPIFGGIVKVLTFREYKIDKDKFDANIKVPKIEGLENEELQNRINEKYIKENKELYEAFVSEMEKLQSKNSGNISISTNYEVKTDNDNIFSIGRYIESTSGSSDRKVKYDTIDKKNQILITLPSLFKNESYTEAISENIKEQMREQMKEDENKVYWIDDFAMDSESEFKNISKEQSFYINHEGKLIISFDKYEIAPGYMGTQEFTIPTEVIKDILVSSEYIK